MVLVMPHFPHWTWEKRGVREKEGEKKKRKGEQGMAWTSGKEEHVQRSFIFLSNQLGKQQQMYTQELIWSQQSHKGIEIELFL